jgi:hypothetical protein
MPLKLSDPKNLGVTTQDIFVVVNSKVMCDVGLICGESITDLAAMRLIKFHTKLYELCYNTQEKYNLTAAPGSRLGVFSGLSSGLTQYYSTMSPPGYYSPMVGNLNVLIPADFTQVFPVLQ